MTLRSASALAGVALSTWSLSARADAHLDYRAPTECPSQADLVSAVASRGGHFVGPEASSNVRNVNIAIDKGPDGFHGSLRIETSDGASSPREVHETDCAKVVEGLAVVAAIALRQPPPSALTRLQGSSFRRDEEVTVKAGTLRFDRARTYSLAAGAQLGPFPRLMPTFEFSMSVAHFVTPPAQPSYLVGNVLQVRWTILSPGTYAFDDGFAVRPWGIQAGVSSCSALTYDTGGLSLLLCGEFAVGAMQFTTTRGGIVTQEKESGFGLAGLGLDANYDIGSHLFLGLRAGGQIQLGNVSAERPDGRELFKAGLFGAHATAGLGLHFP